MAPDGMRPAVVRTRAGESGFSQLGAARRVSLSTTETALRLLPRGRRQQDRPPARRGRAERREPEPAPGLGRAEAWWNDHPCAQGPHGGSQTEWPASGEGRREIHSSAERWSPKRQGKPVGRGPGAPSQGRYEGEDV